jgi:hypothetical protein
VLRKGKQFLIYYLPLSCGIYFFVPIFSMGKRKIMHTCSLPYGTTYYHVVSRQINRTIIWRSYFPFSISSKSCMHKPSNFLHRKYKVLFFENEINGWCWWGERFSFCQLFVCIGTTTCLLNYRVVGLTSASHHTNFKRRIDLMNADKKLYLYYANFIVIVITYTKQLNRN